MTEASSPPRFSLLDIIHANANGGHHSSRPVRWDTLDESLPSGLLDLASDPDFKEEKIHGALDLWRARMHAAVEEAAARYRASIESTFMEAAQPSDEAQGPEAVQDA